MFQEAILQFEADADFVAFSGDMVSGYAWDHSEGWYERTLTKLMGPVWVSGRAVDRSKGSVR